ncbi:TetR family transcriptional regulator [soil metagenome]
MLSSLESRLVPAVGTIGYRYGTGEVTVTTADNPIVRRTPAQGRSTQRFTLILDTMAALIDEVGYASITISLIAKRSGMTGPAVYRYFDDLHSIARALAQRNRERFFVRVTETLGDKTLDWQDAMHGVAANYADMFREEPGFRWLRLGDELDRNLVTPEMSSRALMARAASALFVKRYEVDYRPDLVAHVEVMIEFADALIARAFLFEPDGDAFFIEQCADLLSSYLGNYLAQPYDHDAAPPAEVR